jgi:hypothetical protein
MRARSAAPSDRPSRAAAAATKKSDGIRLTAGARVGAGIGKDEPLRGLPDRALERAPLGEQAVLGRGQRDGFFGHRRRLRRRGRGIVVEEGELASRGAAGRAHGGRERRGFRRRRRRGQALPLHVEEKGIGAEHARISALDEAGDGHHAEGQAGQRVQHADVDGARRERIQGQPLPLEARFQDALHLAPGRARAEEGEAPEIGHDVAHRLAVPLAPQPLIHHAAQARRPVRPRGLSAQRVQGAGEELDDAEEGVRVHGPATPPGRALGVVLARRLLAIRLRLPAQPHDPAVEPGHDPDVAAHGVPLRGMRRHVFAEHLRERNGREGEEFHHFRPAQPAAAQEQQQRARGAAEAQGQRGMQAAGDAQAREQVGEQGRVLLGPRKDHAHLLEGHASRRFPEQGAHDAADLRRLAGRGEEIDGVVTVAGPAGRLEEAGLHAREGGRRRRRCDRRQRGLLPIDVADPVDGRPAREAGGRDRGRPDAADPPHGEARGERSQEAALDRVELEVVGHEDLGPLEPASLGQVLAGRAEEGRVIGEVSLDALVETAVEPGQRAQPLAVLRGRARAGRGVEARGIDFRAAELGEGARERDGHAIEGHVRRQLQAMRRFQ